MAAQINVDVAELERKMVALMDAFSDHPLFMTPEMPKALWFVADFYAAGDRASVAAVKEVMGRNALAQMLITDTSGKLAMMSGEATSPDWGEEILTKASAMVQ
ncbi:hypothetical protein N7495_001904 [Penicillium taxi]|uniref:uncharacterized protein n=1 Tax=Penicillium taxi TaxID=168475 RepID=UPI00254516D6|nr:uncharacterized protein N7495_001904 [Penicillium taxi]KAJ5909222.1 hypothetical protein N7495_001904 [Penicillium taxi]